MSVSRAIRASLDARPMLKHPFYQAWTEGRLSREALRAYACQYFRHVDAFPRYVSAVHSACGELGVRKTLLENLIEEERGEGDHPTLWLDFAKSLGATEAEVKSTEAWPETQALVDTFFDVCKSDDYREGLAALLAYEAQVPAVAEAKIDGLAKFYGITSPEAVRFFQVHLEADVAHAASEGELLDSRTDEADAPRLVAAATRARDALLGFLDGAARAAGIAAC
jgi:pyrroloquinoline-quinone synthase